MIDQSQAMDGPRAPRTYVLMIKLVKKNDRNLGIIVDSDGDALQIEGVKQEGLVADWNRDNCNFEVKQNDRVVRVNSVSGDPASLKAEIGAAVELVIGIQRVLQDDRLAAPALKNGLGPGKSIAAASLSQTVDTAASVSTAAPWSWRRSEAGRAGGIDDTFLRGGGLAASSV